MDPSADRGATGEYRGYLFTGRMGARYGVRLLGRYPVGEGRSCGWPRLPSMDLSESPAQAKPAPGNQANVGVQRQRRVDRNLVIERLHRRVALQVVQA